MTTESHSLLGSVSNLETLPAISYATPAEARACFAEWKAWDKTRPEKKPPVPAWINHLMFRLGQLAEEKHPQRAVHEAEIVSEYAKLQKFWEEQKS